MTRAAVFREKARLCKRVLLGGGREEEGVRGEGGGGGCMRVYRKGNIISKNRRRLM